MINRDDYSIEVFNKIKEMKVFKRHAIGRYTEEGFSGTTTEEEITEFNQGDIISNKDGMYEYNGKTWRNIHKQGKKINKDSKYYYVGSAKSS